jgi:cytidylate kinase
MINIAVDGPAGAGKGTVASFLSKEFNLKHLDTGLLYRELARLALLKKISLENTLELEKIALTIDPNCLNANSLRTEEISSGASKVAVLPKIRQILTAKMQHFVNNVQSPYQGAVLDGRDVGTAILPNADLKFFITADAQIRAHRRTNELLEKQNQAELNSVLKGINERDHRDQNRTVTPLQAAPNALIIDTTFLDVEQVCSKIAAIINDHLQSV